MVELELRQHHDLLRPVPGHKGDGIFGHDD